MFSAQTSCWSITVVRTDKSYCARLPCTCMGAKLTEGKKKRNFPKTIISIYFLSQLHLHLRSQWVVSTIVKDCEFAAIKLKVFCLHGHNADQCTVGVMTPQNILT